MSILTAGKGLFSFVYAPIKRLIQLSKGYPLLTPYLGSNTLDFDDVRIAKKYLVEKENWFNDTLTKKYEKTFTQWNKSKYAFAFMGGRVALSACIHALDLKPGDEVLLPGYTCVVVPNAFHFEGIKTIYCDIELDTFGLDASIIEKKITKKTKAILLHHLYGLVCRDYEEIIQLARKHRLHVIEDCAQSTGAQFKKDKVGNLGDVSFYSSEQSKVFTTIQGGIAVTNNDLLGEKLKEYYEKASYPEKNIIDKQLHTIIANFYMYKDKHRWWREELIRYIYRRKLVVSTTRSEMQGNKPVYYGCKMPSPIAAIGLNQLRKIDRYNEERRRTAKKWDTWCDCQGYKKPFIVPDSRPVYLRYPVMVEPEKKKDISWAYRDMGISLGVWFVSNIHPVDWPVFGCPNADKAVKQCVNFPCLMV